MIRFGHLPISLLFLISMLLNACSQKCEELLCSTGPARFDIQFIDKKSGADVFQTGRYSPDDLQLSESSAKIVDISIQEAAESYPVRVIIAFKINEGKQEIELKLGDETIRLHTTVSIHKSDCCSNSFVDEVRSTTHTMSSEHTDIATIEL